MKLKKKSPWSGILSILFSGMLVTGGLATVGSGPAHAESQAATRCWPVGICWTPGLIPGLAPPKKHTHVA
jgi:hypothetical protein